jgi:hypothetical protein
MTDSRQVAGNEPEGIQRLGNEKTASDELMGFGIRWVIGEHNAALLQPKEPGNNY